jgi:hypothetical protein
MNELIKITFDFFITFSYLKKLINFIVIESSDFLYYTRNFRSNFLAFDSSRANILNESRKRIGERGRLSVLDDLNFNGATSGRAFTYGPRAKRIH